MDKKDVNIFRHKGVFAAFLVLCVCGGYNEIINQLLLNKFIESDIKKGLKGKVEDIWIELDVV